MKSKNRTIRIGVYDSGVGGLSVAKCLQTLLPESQYFYLCDNLNFPYGTKSDQEVTGFTVAHSKKFVETYDLDILVIACNTASTVALDGVRRSVEVPVVGVVPAIKPAALLSKSKSIGLLATPATIRRPYTQKLIKDFAYDCNVALQGSSLLVELAETKLRDGTLSKADIQSEIDPLLAQDSRIDVIVLGCTHFPLLKDELCQLYPGIEWIDSGPAIASRVQFLLPSLKINMHTSSKSPGCVVFTAETSAAHSLRSALIPFGFTATEFLKF